MEKTYVGGIKPGQEVLLKGWVHEIRDLSKLKFLLLKDSTGIIQCIVKGEELMKKIENLSLESVVEIKGKAKESKVKSESVKSSVEVKVSEINIINKADPLPIQVNEKASKTTLSKRLDYRFLDLHRKQTQAVFKIQSEIANSFREYFKNKKYHEVFLPSVISTSSEGGTNLYEVKYFEKKAYLAQSPQLYKQMLACSMERVFTITPVWRAEKHNTVRHLNESRQMDIELAFGGQFDVMKELENVVKHVVQKVIDNCQRELKILGIDNLEAPEAKYLSYDETTELLGLNYGDDLGPEDEEALDKKFPNSIVFVHSWPMEIKPFYIMPKHANPESKLSEGFDAIYRGLEITSGGQRIHLPDVLEKILKKKGLNPDNFKEYIDSFRYGAPPHGGWSIGLERITQLIIGAKNIRESVLFPRDRTRLTP